MEFSGGSLQLKAPITLLEPVPSGAAKNRNGLWIKQFRIQ